MKNVSTELFLSLNLWLTFITEVNFHDFFKKRIHTLKLEVPRRFTSFRFIRPYVVGQKYDGLIGIESFYIVFGFIREEGVDSDVPALDSVGIN